jgi:hypothetical protein
MSALDKNVLIRSYWILNLTFDLIFRSETNVPDVSQYYVQILRCFSVRLILSNLIFRTFD